MTRVNTDIVIIGSGLTGLTLAFYLKKHGKKVLLLEKEAKAGGVIHTINENSFTYETGPNTGVVGTPELVELFDDLKDKVQVEVPDSAAKNRWIWKNGRWHALPSGFISAVFTPLFSLKDKFRILAEPFRKPGGNPDETVDQLVLRRMGKSFLNYAVDPFISGIYAGDPSRLVTRYALPKLYNLEQNYGSFIKGAMKKKKEPKTEVEKRVSREVFSVKGGLKNLVKALSEEIGNENFQFKCDQLQVYPKEKGFKVSYKKEGNELIEIEAENVVTTIDSENLTNVLPFLTASEVKDLNNLNYAKVVQVVACYSKWEGIKLNAFGGLVPCKENRDSLGILFPASLFKDRAPKKGAILSVFIGGMRKPEMIEKSDEELREIVLKEIEETLKCEQKPDILKFFRYYKAIPQYEKSSGKRLKAIGKIQNQYKGLILAGNIRDGIGMADRVKQAKQTAMQIIHNQ